MTDWRYIDNPEIPYDADYPFVVVGVENVPAGKFTNAYGAEMFLERVLKNWGRVVDTSPPSA